MAKQTTTKSPKMAGDKGNYAGMIGGTSNKLGATNYKKSKGKK
jgi:hypothetical protein